MSLTRCENIRNASATNGILWRSLTETANGNAPTVIVQRAMDTPARGPSSGKMRYNQLYSPIGSAANNSHCTRKFQTFADTDAVGADSAEVDCDSGALHTPRLIKWRSYTDNAQVAMSKYAAVASEQYSNSIGGITVGLSLLVFSIYILRSHTLSGS